MITEAGPLNLRMGQAGLTCKVHPSVLVTICDSYIRRPSNNVRVIGTLLGNAVEDSVYVKACYTEISEEDDNQVCGICRFEHAAWLDQRHGMSQHYASHLRTNNAVDPTADGSQS